MPARDTYHNHVCDALVKDGWTITDDPLRLLVGTKDRYVDLGAERLVAAQKATHRIAIEIKSVVGPSEVRDLEVALGQYTLSHGVLTVTMPDRLLYLAIGTAVYRDLFLEPIGRLLLERKRVRLLVVDLSQKEIVEWIPTLTNTS